MESSISLGCFGTFGTPNGFQQYFHHGYGLEFNKTLDLNSNEIEIFPQTELFSIKREIIDNHHLVCLSLYSFAREINSSRSGTFIGVGIILRDCYVDSEKLYNLISEFHSDLINNKLNINNSKIQVNKAIELVIHEPNEFELVNSSIIKVPFSEFYSSEYEENSKIFILGNEKIEKKKLIIDFLDDSMRVFHNYDTLYFTCNEEIINNVKKKGLLKTISWDEFNIEKSQIIKKRSVLKNTKSTPKAEFSNENIRPFKEWIYNNNEIWKSNKIKEKVKEHNRLLNYALELEAEIGKHNISPELSRSSFRGNNFQNRVDKSFSEENKTPIFFILSIVFVAILATFTIFFNNSSNDQSTDSDENNIEQSDRKQMDNEDDPSPSESNLSPKPTFELDSADIIKISRKGIKNKSIAQVVDIIFNKNPRDIQVHYAEQQEKYGEELINLNIKCFSNDNLSSPICTCDTLFHIPAFKR